MTENSEVPKIEIASGSLSRQEIERRVKALRPEEKKVVPEIKIDTTPIAREISEITRGQRDLISSLETQAISTEQFFNLSQKQTGELAEALRGMDPEQEKRNWVDLEYAQEFWTRFEPRSWPKFYEKLSGEERALWDDRWQLARAAYYKKALSGEPSKYRENKDLELLGKDKMERLYEIPGVKKMIEVYADAIVRGAAIDVGQGRRISFWEIKDADDFEKIRKALRQNVLHQDRSFQREVGQELIDGEPETDRRAKWDEIKFHAKEADAVAWNLIWVTNLVESADSRYSFRGEVPSNFPGVVMAGEYRHVYHPQERFEQKSKSGHLTWGIFTAWGVTQYKAIEAQMKQKGFDSSKDEVVFRPAEKGKYWTFSRVRNDLVPTDPKKIAKGGRVYEVLAPECYPVTTTGSFLEETEVDGKTLLNYLLEGRSIPWKNMAEDAWGIYLYGKFHKAVDLLEYFNPTKPVDMRQEGWATVWARGFLELMGRLKPGKALVKVKTAIDRGDPLYQRAVKPLQTESTIKAWAIYALFNGVKDVSKKKATFISGHQKGVMHSVLKDKNVGYFTGTESLDIV